MVRVTDRGIASGRSMRWAISWVAERPEAGIYVRLVQETQGNDPQQPLFDNAVAESFLAQLKERARAMEILPDP